MASIDLNIIQRGVTDGFEWSASKGKITAADLGKIGETRTDNSGAMNALPTPFARFFVFKEAFRRVLEEKQNPYDFRKQAGRAYQQLVSNTLDVFELLYNLKWHENQWKSQERKVIIREWNYEENLPTLKKNVPILGNAVESYFMDDLGTDSPKLFFVFLEDSGKEYLLATSAPMTGFITPPDMDLIATGKGQKEFKFAGECYRALDSRPIKRRHGGFYFKDILLFEKRDPDFKNYLYNKLFADGANVDKMLSHLRNYVQSFEADTDIVKSWTGASLKEVMSEDSNPVKVNGLQMYYADGTDEINYLSDVLVKMPFPMNVDRFVSAKFNKENIGYSYMLPLTRDGLLGLHSDNFEFVCNEKSSEVEIKFNVGGKTYRKSYLNEGDGSSPYVLDMKMCKINIDLAIFPNVLSPVPEENKYFKVMLAAADENVNRAFSTNDVTLDFFVKDDDGSYRNISMADTDDFVCGVRKPAIRSVQSDDVDGGTKYYEVFNTRFDAIEISIDNEGQRASFFLFPRWDNAEPSGKAYTYAVDLGTSNTYVSRREKGKYMEPQQLRMDTPISDSMQAYIKNGQKSLVANIEDSYPRPFSRLIKTEFVPPLIDGTSYAFPIKTSLCIKKDVQKLSLFDNSNIAFFYERLNCPANHTIVADLKWADDEDRLRMFVREILLLIKADILQENGNLAETELIWFRPLSFKNSIRDRFTRIWREESSDILNLKNSASQIKCYTESEAPYYYFDTKSSFADRQSVAVLDIGGGSADIVYYSNGKPEIANSVRFGCDVIWGDGFDQMENAKANGIYRHYKDKINFSDKSLQEIYDSMKEDGSEVSSRDIINFWISNESRIRISEKFKTDFSPVFVYHYVALLYYMMSMFRARGLSYPRTLIFSGNGSRYIDNYITTDLNSLEEIVRTIASKFYGSSVGRIEIVLPEYRKESTCYGGLYHKDGPEPEAVVYIGDGVPANYINVAELKAAYKDKVKSRVINEVHKMNAVFIEVMKSLIAKSIAETFNLDIIGNTVEDVVENALESNYQRRVVEECSDDEPFNDTLFFYPVIQGILKLTENCPKAKK